uniref:DNA polymerase III subunit delta n=1 Tax=Cyanothece sp. (strain PCC 7425 / ATCC 29141) TaxID=395961 RepID=B8HLC4_CYAP4
MPVYFFWGEDDYRLNQAVQQLRDRLLDPVWASFNYDKISPEQPDAILQGLNQSMTPPFGAADRLIWLVNTTLGQRCSEELLAELERTLPHLPSSSHLLLTSPSKPDGRSKAVKLLQKYGEIKEFSLIPAWKTEDLLQVARQAAQQIGVSLAPDALDLLVQSVGNDTRQLYSELEKLQLYAARQPQPQPLTRLEVSTLVRTTSQNSLQLAEAIRLGHTGKALELLADLIAQNEPPLRLVATLTRQFRTWLWVKVLTEAGERDLQTIARLAEVGNPKRIYFLQKEVQPLSSAQLQRVLPVLLDLEVNLKQGREAIPTLQTKVIELCCLLA